MDKITIIGAGTMGNGIAHICALSGRETRLCDLSEEILNRALNTITKNLDRMVAKDKISAHEKDASLSRIQTSTRIAESVADSDLVIEAASENEKIKLDIFKIIDTHAPPNAILASNTSSISITKIATATSRPDKVIGMHFFNPVPVMKLVEVIRGYATSDETNSRIVELSKALGKIPVEARDYPGFVSNRVLMPMINEAIYTLHEGIASVEAIDTVMKLGMAHPMGPLQLADFIGLDVCLSILNVLQEGFRLPKYAPCPLLVNMVTAGKLGRKSGEGFYDYAHGGKELIVSKAFV